MVSNFLQKLLDVLEPMGDVITNTIKHQNQEIITLSKDTKVFSIILDNNCYLRNDNMFDSVDTHYTYNNHCYTIIDMSNLKCTERKDLVLKQATQAYWIASK